jgi:uncharacterized Fe-S center protein
MARVLFATRGGDRTSFATSIKKVATCVAREYVKPRDIVGVKVHFGEEGNTEFIPPHLVRPVIDALTELGSRPLVFDTNTLYKGDRENARDHLLLAARHGFSIATLGVPVMIADGVKGKDFVEVPVEGKHFSSVRIASLVRQVDSIVVISHVKGHSGAGFGGAIKNISMGFASRSGKQQMHSDVKPVVNEGVCISCGTCLEWCPANAITMTEKGALIDHEACIGCGECRVTCPEGAIDIDWTTTPTLLQEKMAEYASGSVKLAERNIGFINMLVNVSPDCDCWEWSGERLVRDIGVLGSRDPVAIDQASCDLINEEWRRAGKGSDIWRDLYPKIDYTVQLRHAEEMGVGTREYVLEQV